METKILFRDLHETIPGNLRYFFHIYVAWRQVEIENKMIYYYYMKWYCNHNDMKYIHMPLSEIWKYTYFLVKVKIFYFVTANKYLSSFLLTKRFRFRPLRICKVSRKLYVEPQWRCVTRKLRMYNESHCNSISYRPNDLFQWKKVFVKFVKWSKT